jgi:hypothetical protein
MTTSAPHVGVPILPSEVVTLLTEAIEARPTAGPEALFAIIHSLRESGWTLNAIALPLGVTRETVRLWAKAAEATDGLPALDLPAPPTPPPTKSQVDAKRVSTKRALATARDNRILDKVLPELLSLQEQAQGLRGPSELDPATAAASKRYTELLAEARSAGISPTVLARALGIKPVTIAARLRRHGYRPKAPSENAMPPWADGPYATDDVRRPEGLRPVHPQARVIRSQIPA